MFYVIYTPIHLYLEPHADEADFRSSAASALAAIVAAEEGCAGDGHHERHPAAQHQFKVVKSDRLVQVEMLAAPAIAYVDVREDSLQPQVFGFSGLSRPGFACCWRFFLRAALPVRPPSPDFLTVLSGLVLASGDSYFA
jgi:hypothetical protein